VTSMTQRRSGPVMLRRAGGCRRPRYPHPDVTGPPVTPTTTRLSRGRQESPSGAEGDVGHLGGCRKPVVRPSSFTSPPAGPMPARWCSGRLTAGRSTRSSTSHPPGTRRP
jgi:hypothetical protein